MFKKFVNLTIHHRHKHSDLIVYVLQIGILSKNRQHKILIGKFT
jgi:hypothetical protein